MKRLKAYLFMPLLAVSSSQVGAVLTVVENPGATAGPTTDFELFHDTTLLAAFGVEFWNLRLVSNGTGNASWHGTISGAAPDIFRETEDPTDFIDSSALIRFYGRGGPVGPPQYLNGAEQGSDNWIYLSRNDAPDPSDFEPTSWVQFEFGFDSGTDQATATILRYVHDPADPFADITLPQAIAAVSGVPEPSGMALMGIGALLLARRRR